ncbi:MAG: L-seryl-tRNA(Sec) selenium transferase [Deltaproteobacteria bacterium]|nr:L-seryl-tRNA(Sec) selenium transferase [Deltaproteobacteria bacterium]
MPAETKTKDRLRRLPPVTRVIEILEAGHAGMKRDILAVAAKTAIHEARDLLRKDRLRDAPSPADLARDAWSYISRWSGNSYKRVVNATGVVLHTNLGRAILAQEAIEQVSSIGSAYSNLEYDLDKGNRGKRSLAVEERLCRLTGAESALVVNNNAAAVYLVLRCLARGRRVIVSRGELVEIGGSFRIPDVLSASGAELVEVGTTNRTRLMDYEKAVTQETALFLKVHRSNFALLGFTEETGIGELSRLADNRGLPLVYDMGSAALLKTGIDSIDGAHDPGQALSLGADVVCFSGDKLLGGPQAGIILGRFDLIDPMRRDPMLRVLRLDKLSLSALDATLRLTEFDHQALPVMNMLKKTGGELEKTAGLLAEKIKAVCGEMLEVGVVKVKSRVGGGTSPLVEIESRAVKLKHSKISCRNLSSELRANDTPIVSLLRDDSVLLDVRTLLKGDGRVIVDALQKITRG